MNRDSSAEEVGFEPTDPCRSHDFQSCRFGRSRTPPRSLRPLSLHLLALSRAVAGFCATGDRESSQGRKAAALSGFACVPQGTWLLRTAAPEPKGLFFGNGGPFSATCEFPCRVWARGDAQVGSGRAEASTPRRGLRRWVTAPRRSVLLAGRAGRLHGGPPRSVAFAKS